MKHGVSVALLACALFLSGFLSACSEESPALPPVAEATKAADPAYDGTLEPAAAVLALVPEDVQTVTVTDFDQVRLELGVDVLTGGATPADQAAFWQRAEQERPLLTTGMLRPEEQQLEQTYGMGQADVAWEAHFYDADDQETGWVLRFHDGTDMTAVAKATEASDGLLSGAEVDPQEHLVTSGTTDDPQESWAADPATVAMVGLPANATYVARACTPESGGADLDELVAYAVQFEGSVVTARLGEGRHDLFTRMRTGEAVPAFDQVYDGGVADPRTGRIGYLMTDPAAAARMALEHRLPFAACA